MQSIKTAVHVVLPFIVVMAATLWPAPTQDSEDAASLEPAATFQARFENTIGDGVVADTMVSVSDILFDWSEAPVRVVVATTTFKAGQMQLWQTHTLNTPNAASSDAVSSRAGGFYPGLAKALAAEFLGETDQVVLDSYVTGQEKVPACTVSVRPASEWASVASGTDLIVEVEPVLE